MVIMTQSSFSLLFSFPSPSSIFILPSPPSGPSASWRGWKHPGNCKYETMVFCDIPSSRGQQFLPAKSWNISKHQVEVQSWQFMIINTYLKEAHVSNLVIFPFKNFQIFLFGILPSDLNFWKCLMALKLIFFSNRICILSLLSWLAD